MKKLFKSLTVILFSVLAIAQNLPNISTQTKGQLPVNRLNAPGVAGLCLQTDGLGNVATLNCSGTISGTVTNFSAGTLSPIFTTSVTNPTTTPSLAFILTNAAAHTFLGNNTGILGLPGYVAITANDLPGSGAVTVNTASPLGGGGSLTLGSSITLTCSSCITSIPQLPITKTGVTSNWIRSYDSTTGLFVASQPAYSDISGTPQLAVTKSAIASNWINSYSSVTGLFTATQPATSDLSDFPSQVTNSGKFLTTNGTVLSWATASSGSGTVTSFSSGNLSPLFTTSVATATTTPAQSFALSTAGAHLFFGNNTAITASPAYEAIGNGDLPGSGGVTLNTTSPLTGGGLVTLGNALTFACPSCLTSVTAHNLLSATHGDTTTHSVLRGDLIAGIGAVPTWTAVAKGGTNTYPKWNANGDVIASTNPASGTGSPTTCTNQAVTAFTLNADAAPTSSCSTITSAFTSGTFPATAHNLLSATHGDTTPGSVVTGDVISGQSSAWARMAGNSTTTPQYLKSLGSGAAATAPSWAQVAYTDLSGVPSTFAPTAHNILSTAHGDTTAAAAVRGDGFFAIGVTPTWQRLAHPATTGGYFKWNGTDIVASSLAASGTGNCGANQFETGSNADASPTCAQPSFTNLSGSVTAGQMPALTGDVTSTAGTTATTLATVATPGTNTKITFNAKGLVTSGAQAVLASADFVNQGTTTTLLHGNAAGNPSFAGVNLINDASANQGTVNQLLHGNAAGQPSFSAVASADLNLTTTTCTNQFVTAISAGGVGTCTTDTLASAQHANQGTTTTVLHGNAAGNPAFSAVTSADTTGTFPPTAHNLLSATHGDSTTGTVARGDVITGQGASPTWTRLAKGTANQVLSMDGTGTDVLWTTVSGTGTVTNVATTSPITGGPITTTGTIACATCTTNAAALTSGQLVTGAGGQATQVGNLSGDVATSGSTATTLAPSIAGTHAFTGLTNITNLSTVRIVDGTTLTTIQGCINALPSGGGTCLVPPNDPSGQYLETLTANIVFKKNVVLQFLGQCQVTQGAFIVSVPQGADDVSIIAPFSHSSDQGGNSQGCAFQGYTGSAAAIDIGSSAGFTYNTMINGIVVNLFSAAANAIGIRRTNGVAGPYEYDEVIFGPVAGQIGFQFVGTGVLFDGTSNIVGPECNSSSSATNNKCIQWTGVNQNGYSIVGGHANMGGSANGSVCLDAASGASKIDTGGFYCDVAATAITVESTANTAVRGWLIADSGVTLFANFAASTNGNMIWTNTRSIGTQLVTDSGTAVTNSVINGFDNQWNSRRWRVISEAGATGFQIVDQSDSTQAIAKGVGGATHIDSSAGNPVRVDQNTGSGFEVWNNTAAVATISNTGLGTFNGGVSRAGEGAIVADTGSINTTETIIVKSDAALPANSLIAKTVIRIPFAGTNTSSVANTSTFTLRMGTLGTTSDAAIFTAVMAVSAATGTNVPFEGEVICTVRTVGASGTGFCKISLVNPNATSVATASTGISVIPLQLVLPTMSTFNTTTASNIISLTYKSAASTTTSIFKEGAILIGHN